MTIAQIIDLSITGFISLCFIVLVILLTKKFKLALAYMILLSANIALNYFGYTISSSLVSVLLSASLFAYFYNSSFVRKLILKARKAKKHNKNFSVSDEEKEKLIKNINEAVLDLSATKTGALITVETLENLTDFIDNGVKIDAPITSSLLRTIFYPGTPLHDGAVIVRGNTVMAASVFYNPTTRAMSGKFGARHRAALGFSESHEGVTIIVSEETGRISFAINGELLPVSLDNFKKKLENYLN